MCKIICNQEAKKETLKIISWLNQSILLPADPFFLLHTGLSMAEVKGFTALSDQGSEGQDPSTCNKNATCSKFLFENHQGKQSSFDTTLQAVTMSTITRRGCLFLRPQAVFEPTTSSLSVQRLPSCSACLREKCIHGIPLCYYLVENLASRLQLYMSKLHHKMRGK